MEFFRIRRDIPFMRHALVFNIISLITFLLAVVSLATKGLHFSVEFTGGTVMEVSYPQAADLEKIRGALDKLGFPDATVQNFGTSRDVLLRLPLKPGRVERAAVREGDGRRCAARARRSSCGGSSSSGRRWARSSPPTARSRSLLVVVGHHDLPRRSASSGASRWRPSSRTCTTW